MPGTERTVTLALPRPLLLRIGNHGDCPFRIEAFAPSGERVLNDVFLPGETRDIDERSASVQTAIVTAFDEPSVLGAVVAIGPLKPGVDVRMPAGFDAPYHTQAWVPLRLTAEQRTNRNSWFLQTVGRLAPGQTPDIAAAALTQAMERLTSPTSKFNRDRVAKVITWQDAEVNDVRSGLWMLQAMALTVLLVAGANLANLLLANATGRAREITRGSTRHEACSCIAAEVAP